jgi:hypothetical protein
MPQPRAATPAPDVAAASPSAAASPRSSRTVPAASHAATDRSRGPRWRRRSLLLSLTSGAALVLAACSSGPAGDLEFSGPDDGELVNAEQLSSLVIEVAATEDRTVEDLILRHDGTEVTDVERTADRLRWEPGELEDGEHRVTVEQVPDEQAAVRTVAAGTDDGADDAEAEEAGDDAEAEDATELEPAEGEPAEGELVHEWRFAVNATPPELELTSPDGAVVAGEPVTVAGTTEPGATVRVQDDETVAGEDGTFEIELAEAFEGDLQLVAIDEAGNTSDDTVALVTVPSRVEVSTMRGVHVTPHAWATDSFRQRILGMIDDGIINSVTLTLKDEGGRVGWDSDVELAIESGANEGVYDLDEVVADLHERGVHIAGRIVAFRDPVLGQYALDSGHLEWLIQTTDGEPYTGRYGCCFTSFAHEDVIEYNLALAEEAAAAGVDDILWDYIRRPDGSPDAMVVPGLSEDADGATLEDAVIDFARLADERLRRYGVGHGASLYGIAADRPTQIAQDVPGLAEHLDYVAPMIYPSHWGPGEYGVEDPNRQPYDIITATLEIWNEQTEGTRARVVPWLEDTNYRAWDRAEQVREQIRASRDQGIDEFMMWDPGVNYTVDAYDRLPTD